MLPAEKPETRNRRRLISRARRKAMAAHSAPLSLGLQVARSELLDGALDSLAAFPKAGP